jgi:drug/metabolite transporter (DMT)-like permease
MAATQSGSKSGSVAAALVLVQVFFGLHYLAAKLVLLEIPPRAWALIRVSGAALLLLIAARAMGRRFPRWPGDWGRLALLSVLGVMINQVCFVEGLSRTTQTHSALINTTIPVDTLLFAVVLGREKLRLRKVVAVLVAFAGVLLVIRPGAAAGASRLLVGDLLTLINAASYSLFLVLSRRVLLRCDPLAATALLLGFGSLGIAVIGVPQLLTLSTAAVSPRVWLLGLFIILLPTAGAYLLQTWALARVESSVVAFFIFLQPVIATSLSVVWLGEQLDASVIAGALLILVGVYVTLARRRGPR